MLEAHRAKKARTIINVREAQQAVEDEPEVPIVSDQSEDGLRTPPKNGAVKPDQIKYYSPFSQTILKQSKIEFRKMIFTISAFPDQNSRIQFGKKAWKAAADACPKEYAQC